MTDNVFLNEAFTLMVKHQNVLFDAAKHIVLLTFDDNYVNQSINLMMSISRYHGNQVSYICMCPVLQQGNINTLLSLQYGIQILCYSYKPIIDPGKWPECAIYRIFSPWLLDESIDKVLYMDSDIICSGSLYDLFGYTPKYLAMCNEIAGNSKHWQQRVNRKYLGPQIYCNSGVCIFNLKSLREDYLPDQLIYEIRNLKDVVKFPDQDFLNYYFAEKRDLLNALQYNFQPYEFYGSILYERILKDCRLIHFAAYKPWDYKAGLGIIRLYLKHSEYEPMIEMVKPAYHKSIFPSLLRFFRPIYYPIYRFYRNVRNRK